MCITEVATSLSPLEVDIMEVNKMGDNWKSRDRVRTKPLVTKERSQTRDSKVAEFVKLLKYPFSE